MKANSAIVWDDKRLNAYLEPLPEGRPWKQDALRTGCRLRRIGRTLIAYLATLKKGRAHRQITRCISIEWSPDPVTERGMRVAR